MREVRPQSAAGDDEEDRGGKIEWLENARSAQCPDNSCMLGGRAYRERRTPPLFRARTCSIVLSLLRGAVLEKGRKGLRKLLSSSFRHCCPVVPFLDIHDVFEIAASRGGLGLWEEANVRCGVMRKMLSSRGSVDDGRMVRIEPPMH